MPTYEIYAYCNECSQRHSVHAKITDNAEFPDGTSVSEAFAGRPIPGQITFIQTNKYKCPHTNGLFMVSDLDLATLYRVNSTASATE